ncbi:LLM class oxidoreductase [Massilia sp. ST3]|uniref:LLM class oxidoreductase n=1 Tax=Massilia sp. ST3 TaxID=2824903 RepID=UPI001B8341B1|nr:LLM class oxidoreductase [Massilia sp. ST3]MBQ5949272.1 LLM class oxidoreductase [Massilia sp. ST3]
MTPLPVTPFPAEQISPDGSGLAHHPGFQRLFRPGELTVGLILPLETHPRRPAPTMAGHLQMARRAEQLGFGALWMRDVPFYDPAYGDVGQVYEPMVYMAYLAAATTRIVLGTAGIVLPTREPLILAKQATSLDQLSGGRLVLGLSSGDRTSDYPMFGIDFASRGERYREAYGVLRSVTEERFPAYVSEHFGRAGGSLELVPRPAFGRIPSIAVGRSQQSLAWLAEHLDGHLAFVPAPEELAPLVRLWRTEVARAAGEAAFKPIGIGGFFDLSDDPDQPFQRIHGGFRAGRNGLRDYLLLAREAGVSHMALNPKVSRQPYAEIMDQLSESVLPVFPALA